MFPTDYVPGDLAPAAWANDVGQFLNDIFVTSITSGSVPSGTGTKMTGLTARIDPRGVVNNPGAGDLTLPTGQLWVITANVYLTASTPAGARTFIQVVDGGSRVRRVEGTAIASGDYAMNITSLWEGLTATPIWVEVYSQAGGGPWGVDSSRSAVYGHRIY